MHLSLLLISVVLVVILHQSIGFLTDGEPLFPPMKKHAAGKGSSGNTATGDKDGTETGEKTTDEDGSEVKVPVKNTRKPKHVKSLRPKSLKEDDSDEKSDVQKPRRPKVVRPLHPKLPDTVDETQTPTDEEETSKGKNIKKSKKSPITGIDDSKAEPEGTGETAQTEAVDQSGTAEDNTSDDKPEKLTKKKKPGHLPKVATKKPKHARPPVVEDGDQEQTNNVEKRSFNW